MFRSLCGIQDLMMFECVDDGVMNQVEEFARNEVGDIILSMKSAGEEINEIDFYGDIYVHKPSSFKLTIGDRLLISRLTHYAKTIQFTEKTSPDTKQPIEEFTANQTTENYENPTRKHYFLNKMLDVANKNASRPVNGYRYDDETKSYASYYRLLSGPLAYETLQKNLPCALPSLSTVNRYIHT